jgi:hypothetical protein
MNHHWEIDRPFGRDEIRILYYDDKTGHVASLFVATKTYMYWTPDLQHHGQPDYPVCSAFLTVAEPM